MDIPAEKMVNLDGIGVDSGYATIKIAQVCHKDGSKADQQPGLKLSTYSCEDMDKAVACITDSPSITKDSSGHTNINTTGIRARQLRKCLQEKNLSCKEVNALAWMAAAKGFKFLSSFLKPDQLFNPTKEGGVILALQDMAKFASFKAAVDKFSSGGADIPGEQKKKDVFLADYITDGLYPCLLVNCGSTLEITKIDEDGTASLLDTAKNAGGTFLSIAATLLGPKSYEELAELASNGTYTAVDTTFADVKAEGSDDAYAMMPDEIPIYAYGKGTEKPLDSFKPEDIANSTFCHIMRDISILSDLVALSNGVKRIYFHGNFLQHSFIEEQLAKYMVHRNFRRVPPLEKLDIRVITNGAYLGAIGCMLENNTLTST